MKKLLHDFFKTNHIKYYRALPIEWLAEDIIISPRRMPMGAKYVVPFLIPYRCNDNACRNISEYAVPRDYHLFASHLGKELKSALLQSGIDAHAEVFADTSPFAEAKLACLAKLGFIGRNGLVINPEYGSYVFLGEVVTDACLEDFYGMPPILEQTCMQCGACVAACPGKCLDCDDGICYSALSQQKKLTEHEQALLSKHNLLWGCDTCQSVCPHNKNAAYTQIEFFRTCRIPKLSLELIKGMSDEEFSQRAYSWRGRQVIMRNASLLDIITDSHDKINKENP